jgi:hypothetical protein
LLIFHQYYFAGTITYSGYNFLQTHTTMPKSAPTKQSPHGLPHECLPNGYLIKVIKLKLKGKLGMKIDTLRTDDPNLSDVAFQKMVPAIEDTIVPPSPQWCKVRSLDHDKYGYKQGFRIGDIPVKRVSNSLLCIDQDMFLSIIGQRPARILVLRQETMPGPGYPAPPATSLIAQGNSWAEPRSFSHPLLVDLPNFRLVSITVNGQLQSCDQQASTPRLPPPIPVGSQVSVLQGKTMHPAEIIEPLVNGQYRVKFSNGVREHANVCDISVPEELPKRRIVMPVRYSPTPPFTKAAEINTNQGTPTQIA